MKMHQRLRNEDKRDPLIPRSDNNNNAVGGVAGGGASSVRSGRSNKSTKKSKSGTLTEALLDDAENGEGGGGTVEKETTGTPNWWENQ